MKILSFSLLIIAVICLNSISCFTLEDLDLQNLTNELEKIDLNLEDVDLSVFHDQFEKYDLDEDGRFNYKEFYELYKEEGDKFDDDIIQIQFQEADQNKDNFVDFDEILIFSIRQMEAFKEQMTQETDPVKQKEQDRAAQEAEDLRIEQENMPDL